MDYADLYVQVQAELSSLLLKVMEARDKVEVSRYFAQSQGSVRSLFSMGAMKQEETTRLQQLHSMRYLLQGKRRSGDKQVEQAYTAVSAEIGKLLRTTPVPIQSQGIYAVLMQKYHPDLPDSERLSETISLIVSVPEAFNEDFILRKVLKGGLDSPLGSLDRSSITHRSQDIEESDEEIREFTQNTAAKYRSEALKRLLSS